MTVSAKSGGAALPIAGILGPIGFIALVIIQGILHPDYSHIRMPVSALAAWPSGWIQRLNFYILAALMAVFAVGVHRAVQPARYGLLGIALMLASCLGLVIAGLFPWIMVDGVPRETRPHVVGAILSFSGASTGLIALSRRMRLDARWRSLAPYLLTTGLVMLILFVVLGAFAIQDGAPLHPWAGLLQRVVVLLWFACTTIIALRARRLGSSGERAG
jgi:hypothetical membrane protein